jgi:hypothetical protein
VIMNEAPVPGEYPARHREEDSVAVLELGPTNRAPKHIHLVSKHGVLKLRLRDAPASGQYSHQAHGHDVGEGWQGARDATD